MFTYWCIKFRSIIHILTEKACYFAQDQFFWTRGNMLISENIILYGAWFAINDIYCLIDATRLKAIHLNGCSGVRTMRSGKWAHYGKLGHFTNLIYMPFTNLATLHAFLETCWFNTLLCTKSNIAQLFFLLHLKFM